jgi:hypothetical protein
MLLRSSCSRRFFWYEVKWFSFFSN